MVLPFLINLILMSQIIRTDSQETIPDADLLCDEDIANPDVFKVFVQDNRHFYLYDVFQLTNGSILRVYLNNVLDRYVYTVQKSPP